MADVNATWLRDQLEAVGMKLKEEQVAEVITPALKHRDHDLIKDEVMIIQEGADYIISIQERQSKLKVKIQPTAETKSNIEAYQQAMQQAFQDIRKKLPHLYKALYEQLEAEKQRLQGELETKQKELDKAKQTAGVSQDTEASAAVIRLQGQVSELETQKKDLEQKFEETNTTKVKLENDKKDLERQLAEAKTQAGGNQPPTNPPVVVTKVSGDDSKKPPPPPEKKTGKCVNPWWKWAAIILGVLLLLCVLWGWNRSNKVNSLENQINDLKVEVEKHKQAYDLAEKGRLANIGALEKLSVVSGVLWDKAAGPKGTEEFVEKLAQKLRGSDGLPLEKKIVGTYCMPITMVGDKYKAFVVREGLKLQLVPDRPEAKCSLDKWSGGELYQLTCK